MPLTDMAVRNAKPGPKPIKLADGGGLFLLVNPTGNKLWRMKFRFEGKEKTLSIGLYPDVGLAEARKQRDMAKEQLALGRDPAREKKLAKIKANMLATDTFEAVAAEYCKKRKRDGAKAWSKATATRCEYLLGQLMPAIGKTPVTEIEPIEVLEAVRRLEKKGNHESAVRALQLASLVFRYAIATARLSYDPTRDLRGALTTPTVTHLAAIIEPKQVGELLRAIDGYQGQGLAKIALQLAPHVFVRPGELRQAEWQEIDLDAAVWTIPPHKTKMRKPHHVPLSRQVIELFRFARMASGPDGYVFPSMRARKRPMSENTLNAALRRLGYGSDEMTAHGFRAMASTLLNESGKWSADAIERALAHGDSDKVRAAYHRGAHWNERVEMAQWWSDYLDELRARKSNA